MVEVTRAHRLCLPGGWRSQENSVQLKNCFIKLQGVFGFKQEHREDILCSGWCDWHIILLVKHIKFNFGALVFSKDQLKKLWLYFYTIGLKQYSSKLCEVFGFKQERSEDMLRSGWCCCRHAAATLWRGDRRATRSATAAPPPVRASCPTAPVAYAGISGFKNQLSRSSVHQTQRGGKHWGNF